MTDEARTLFDCLARAPQCRVLVMGDVMLDRYWTGEVARISPEAPVPILKVSGVQDLPGGAGNVARNMAALGAQVTLVGVVGQDEGAHALRAMLREAGIDARLHVDAALRTTIKLRAMGQHQQLMRIDFEGTPGQEVVLAASAELESLLAQHDTVVLSDYGKGTLQHVARLIASARQAGKPVFVDPKGDDYARYAGASVITPNRGELRAVVGAWADDAALFDKAQTLREQLGLQALLVTRSEEGLTLFLPGQVLHERAQARQVFDVSGAGDTVIAALTVLRASGAAWPLAVRAANAAGGVAVGKLGAQTVSAAELREALAQLDAQDSRAHAGEQPLPMNALQAHAWMAQQKALGHKVVMTNGCFDLLHPGHLAYLQQARALGDVLIVALNTDASVQRLKGPLRPINDLATRASMMAALGAVNAVVAFDEDTPEQLVSALLPHVLVKGGDYTAEQVAGGQAVRAAGGEVRILPFLPGHSSTQLIARIRRREPG